MAVRFLIPLALFLPAARGYCSVTCSIIEDVTEACNDDPCLASCWTGQVRGVDCGLDWCCPKSPGL